MVVMKVKAKRPPDGIVRDCDPWQALAIEMVAGAVDVVRTAVDRDYLDGGLRITPLGERIALDSKWGRCPGFQPGVVLKPQCIANEVEFLRGPALDACLEVIGCPGLDRGAILGKVGAAASNALSPNRSSG